MEVEETFVLVSGLICEPSRARMLWQLLDGRALTARELCIAADVSTTSASNHLSRLLAADLVKAETQGRHRYFSFSNAEVAYVVEALAHLANNRSTTTHNNEKPVAGIKYCRTCYDHLAGYVGVEMAEAMRKKSYLKKADKSYTVTQNGWQWFSKFDISKNDFINTRRPLTRQCLDWSERRPHLAGSLGAVLLNKMLERRWFKKVQSSRELVITSKGKQELYEWLDITL